MFININLLKINLEGSGIVYDPDDNLYDLFAQYGDGCIPTYGPVTFYYLFSDNHIFALTDALEKNLSNNGHEICWEWTGVRKGVDYYLKLDVKTLSEATNLFFTIFGNIFSDVQKLNNPFEFPEVDSPLNLDDPETFDSEGDYEECDEEAILRDFENLTVKNPDIQWKREPKEYGGSVGSIVLLGTAVGLGAFSYTFLKDFVKFGMQKHYKKVIETLEQKVIEACQGQGRIISPEPKAPEVYNIEREEKEYEFTQIMSDGTRNKVFIGVNSGKVTFVPYQ